MSRGSAAAFLDLVSARRGHFRMESGHHGALWLDLDTLFADERRIAPFVADLVDALRPYQAEAVCGPLQGGAFLAQLVAQSLGADFWFTERVMPKNPDGLYRARYVLPAALAARASGRRVAMVDDVMSAGSALRGTNAELRAHGATPVVAGALLILGSVGAAFFATENVPVVGVARDDYELWTPAECPQCARGLALEDVATPTL